jgi:sugar fermentation stimulation protein A
MKLEPALFPATLIIRYKRFLADVELDNGDVMTVHTPNTGSMLGLSEPGMRVWLRDTQNPKRKYRYSWEMSEPTPDNLVGVHTGIVNQLVTEAIESNRVPELSGYDRIQSERPYGSENSRIDLLLSGQGQSDCYVEIKNVTAIDEHKTAIFPDAVSMRGQKHLRELMQVVKQGGRAVMFYCIQRQDCNAFRPAHEIDPNYATLLKEADENGVEILAYQTHISPSSIEITDSVKILREQFT